jgi:predicted tellurium resistance membrane protein TerC
MEMPSEKIVIVIHLPKILITKAGQYGTITALIFRNLLLLLLMYSWVVMTVAPMELHLCYNPSVPAWVVVVAEWVMWE